MASARIILEINGTIVDDVTANMSDEALSAAVLAMADKYGYQETVTDDEGNEVTNPVSKYRFFSTRLRRHAEQVTAGWDRDNATAQAQAESQERVAALLDSIEVE